MPESSVNDTIKKQPEMAANQTDVRDSVKIDGQVVKS
jgi:hypothetical protein